MEIEARQENRTALLALSPKLFDSIRHAKKRRFLAAYAVTGGIRAASALCGIDTRFHYLWLERDESGEYAEAFERARQIACDNGENEIYRRGFRGYQRELHYKGHKTGESITEYSDTLASLFLNANREKYRDGPSAVIGPSVINLVVNPASPALPAIDVTKTLPEPDTVTTQSQEMTRRVKDSGLLSTASVVNLALSSEVPCHFLPYCFAFLSTVFCFSIMRVIP